MHWYEVIGGAGLLLFYFALGVLAVIALARLGLRAEAWLSARRATPPRRPETARVQERRASPIIGCTRFSVIDTAHPRDVGRRR